MQQRRPAPKMNRLFTALSTFNIAPVFAGDAAKGESEFKKCKACHAVISPYGTEIVKGGKTGPSLFGVIGRQAGSVPDFGYGDAITAVGAGGFVWDEASLAAYLIDPTSWLKEKTGDAAAKSKMSFKLSKGGEDVAAWLATLK